MTSASGYTANSARSPGRWGGAFSSQRSPDTPLQMLEEAAM
jgi:hypothetical protein